MNKILHLPLQPYMLVLGSFTKTDCCMINQTENAMNNTFKPVLSPPRAVDALIPGDILQQGSSAIHAMHNQAGRKIVPLIRSSKKETVM